MLKNLAIPAVLIAFLLGGPSMAQNKQPSANTPASQPQRNRKILPPPGAVVDMSATAPLANKEAASQKSNPPEKPLPRFLRPEWVIVYVTIVYAFIAFFTLRAIKTQGDFMKRQARALENAERARISVEASRLGNFSFQFTAKNIGKTSAKVTYARGFSVFVNKGKTLPDVPAYLSGEPIGFEPVQWVGPGDGLELVLQDDEGHCHPLLIGDLSEPSMRNNIRHYGHSLWVYGRILYFDGISEGERDFRFCFGFRVEAGEETLYYSGGPEAYRRDG
jgi:hypothetical protein